jgi:hypothetical protein
MSSEPSDTFDTSVSRCGCPDADPQRKDPHSTSTYPPPVAVEQVTTSQRPFLGKVLGDFSDMRRPPPGDPDGGLWRRLVAYLPNRGLGRVWQSAQLPSGL